MLSERIVIAVTFLPIGLAAFIMGGWFFTLVMLIFLVAAAWEYVKLFERLGFKGSSVLTMAAVAAIGISRHIDGFSHAAALITGLILLAMTFHLVSFERGRDQAATDFAIDLTGFMYIGWMGAYFISMRALPDGMWWLLLVLPCVWMADSAAYFTGRRWGKHKLAPRLSPKKTLEGYLGGIAGGLLGGLLLGALFQVLAPSWSQVTFWQGGVIGLVMGVLPTLGDLGESMIKRQAGAKDSGDAIPGHGGFFDRIDSWLWAAPIAYYLIIWFF